jgi:uncharacterized membrane protein YecN with MAPEG domain
MTSLPVSTFLAAIFAGLLVLLSGQVSLRRARTNIAFGDGGDETLRRRIRAHGNFIEYAPLAIIVVGLTEHHDAPSLLAWGLSAAFGASRILHAIGMLYTSHPILRGLAMLMNHAGFLAAGGWLASRLMMP